MKLALISIFIEPKTPPLGLGSIATYLEKYSNFKDTTIIDINYDNIIESLEKLKPDLIGISAMTLYYGRAINLAEEIKKKFNIPIIIGGNHISTLPESIKPCFDIGIVGEGEETMKELVELYINKKNFAIDDLHKIKGVCFYDGSKFVKTEPRPLITPLDKIPIVNRDYFSKEYFKKKRLFGTGTFEIIFTLMSARGCPYRCKFCSPSIMWGRNVRFHSVDRVVEEIKMGVKKYKATHIMVSDDLVTISKDRLRELYTKLKEQKILDEITLAMNTRANLVDEELCFLFKKLKVVSTAIGFESGNEEMLKYLKNNSVTVEDNKRAILLFEKYKIRCFGSFIFGSPNETLDQMRYTIKLVKFAYKHRIAFIYPFLMKPYPGTEIWEIAKKKGIVSNNMNWGLLCTFIEDINEHNKPLTLNENIDIKEFKKVYNVALRYAKLISLKRLIRSFFLYPISTIYYIGNPFVFIKDRYNLIKKGTFENLKSEKQKKALNGTKNIYD